MSNRIYFYTLCTSLLSQADVGTNDFASWDNTCMHEQLSVMQVSLKSIVVQQLESQNICTIQLTWLPDLFLFKPAHFWLLFISKAKVGSSTKHDWQPGEYKTYFGLFLQINQIRIFIESHILPLTFLPLQKTHEKYIFK
jgi:hypothetical protein